MRKKRELFDKWEFALGIRAFEEVCVRRAYEWMARDGLTLSDVQTEYRRHDGAPLPWDGASCIVFYMIRGE